MKIIGYALCLNNDENTSSLEVRKIYPIVEPYANDPKDYLRIIDESGEDYIYSNLRFSLIKLPSKLKKQVEKSLALA